MRKGHLVSLLIALLAGAFLFVADRSNAVEPAHHEDGGNHSALNTEIARADMLNFAAQHLAVATPHTGTVGSAPDWTEHWDLHWMDFHEGEHHVRIYHASHRHHAHIRYVLIADPHHVHNGEWTPVH